MEVIGIERVDYISKKTGNPVKGLNLHMCYVTEKINGMGVVAEFIPERVECNAKIGDQVELLYNKFGQVSKVFIA